MVLTGTKTYYQRNTGVPSRAQKKARVPRHLDEHDLAQPSLSERITASSKDVFKQSCPLVILPGIALIFDKNRDLLRKALSISQYKNS